MAGGGAFWHVVLTKYLGYTPPVCWTRRPPPVPPDPAKPGAVINKNIDGQFAEHPGAGIFAGLHDGTDVVRPEQARQELTAPARAPQGRRTLIN